MEKLRAFVASLSRLSVGGALQGETVSLGEEAGNKHRGMLRDAHAHGGLYHAAC